MALSFKHRQEGDGFVAIQQFQNDGHPVPDRQVFRNDFKEPMIRCPCQNALQRVNQVKQRRFFQHWLIGLDRRGWRLLSREDLPPQPLLAIKLPRGLFELPVLQ